MFCQFLLNKRVESESPEDYSIIPTVLQIKTYRTVILPVAVYGCGTWSLTLREEHKLRVYFKVIFMFYFYF